MTASSIEKVDAIGGGKRKWRNVVGFAGSLAAAADVELNVNKCIGFRVS